MGSRTTRHDLYKPDDGEDGWGDEKRTDIDKYDKRFKYHRVDVTSTSVTANVYESLWVDTSAAGGNVTVTLPADGDAIDGDRVEVGIEDATNDTTVSANTNQSILGSPTTLSGVAETLTLEYKKSSKTWMVR